MAYLSVCIPTYEMRGLGVKMLQHNLSILVQQTFTDFDVVISDHSKNNQIQKLCDSYLDRLAIKYFRNPKKRGNPPANLNNAIRKATGKLIKILFQDDFLFVPTSLERIVANFDLTKDHWLVTACEHSRDGTTFFRPFYPKYSENIQFGNPNTISSPSVLTVLNDHPLLFDERLIWLMDVDYYKRCFLKFGSPKILNEMNVVNRVGSHQVSFSNVNEKIKEKEFHIITKKFGDKLDLKDVTLVSASDIKIPETILALRRTRRAIDFKEILLISSRKPHSLPRGIRYRKCSKLKTLEDYSRFVLYKLHTYVHTTYVLVIQYDGYVINPYQWRESFLDYDYIGAPWPKNLHFTKEGINVQVGNGGFSLRSKKLLNALNNLRLPFTDNSTGYSHEDGVICNYYRKELEDFGIKFASVEIASLFSKEQHGPNTYVPTFGFHGKGIAKKLERKPFWQQLRESLYKKKERYF